MRIESDIPAQPARVLVLVMTYNEASNIARLVPQILLALPTASVLVVDDKSPDGTGDVVRALAANDARIRLLTREDKRGYGSATIAGLRSGVREGFDAIATLDADFSHDPADLPRLIDGLSTADVSIGSRYVGGVRVLNWDVRRLLLSLGANSYVRLLSGLSCFDCTSGFRAYKVDVLKGIAFDKISSTGYAFLPDLLFALGSGVRVQEVPICYTERRVGSSKMAKRVIIEAMLRPWILFCRRMVRALWKPTPPARLDVSRDPRRPPVPHLTHR